MNRDRNPVGWFEIYVSDMDSARKFYETILDTQLEQLPCPTDDMEMWAFPMDQEKPGACGALVKMEGHHPDNGCPRVMVYFSCIDCAEDEARVEAAGGKIHQPKMDIGDYGFISIFLDPDGNAIGLHSMQ